MSRPRQFWIRDSLPLSDNPQRRELIELLSAQSEQIAEDFARILPEERRGQLVFDGGFGKTHWTPGGRAGGAVRGGKFDFFAPVPHLRGLEYFLLFVVRPAG